MSKIVKVVIVLSLVICNLHENLKAQQTAQYTNYNFNLFVTNPALAGTKECLDFKLGYRQQWVGFDGAPRTFYVSSHSILSKNKYDIRNKHGIGIFLESDKIGPFSRLQFNLAYSYHLPINRKVVFSMGAFLGAYEYRFRANEVTLANFNDNVINMGSNSKLLIPIITPGFLLQGESWLAGFSMQQVIGSEIQVVGTSESKTDHHFLLMGGKFFELSKKYRLITSVLVKSVRAAPLAFDVNASVEWQKKITFGLTYRNQDAMAATVKFNFLNFYTVGYAFDYTTSKIQLASSNTHEIMFGINPCGYRKKSKIACPTFL